MSYILKHDETFQQALHRISHKEMKYGMGLLELNGTAPKNIHKVRKSIKRSRALLRLARPLMKAEAFKHGNKLLRQAANNLSGARDADVMLLTLARLRQQSTNKKKFNLFTRDFKIWLNDKRKASRAEFDNEKIAETIELLDMSRNHLTSLKLGKTQENPFQTSIEAMFSNGRLAFINAYHDNQAEAYHEYRKSVQLYHRQMQLLVNVWPELIAVYISAAKDLGELLGDDHDLFMLNEAIIGHNKLFPEPQKMEFITGLITQSQKKMRAQAFLGGHRLFISEKPKAFALRMVTYMESSSMKLSDF